MKSSSAVKGRRFPVLKIKKYIQRFQRCNYVYRFTRLSSVIFFYLNEFLEISVRNLNDHDAIKRYIVQVKILTKVCKHGLFCFNCEVVNYIYKKIYCYPQKLKNSKIRRVALFPGSKYGF